MYIVHLPRLFPQNQLNAAEERPERRAGAQAGAAERQAVLRGARTLPPSAEVEVSGDGGGNVFPGQGQGQGHPHAHARPAGHHAQEAR